MSISSVGSSISSAQIAYAPPVTPTAPSAAPKGRDSDGNSDGSGTVAAASANSGRLLNIVA
jgi:hypothetical protein